MVQPELGTKRTCQQCASRFYDLGRDPIVCPKCGFQHTTEMFNRSRRGRLAEQVRRTAKADAALPDEDLPEADLEVEESEEEEEEEVIEDASELGEDEEDLAEVIENVDDTDTDTEER